MEGAGGRTRLWVYVSPRHTQRSRASCRVRRPGSSTPEAPPSPRFSTVPAAAPPGRRVIRFKGWKEIRRPLQSCPCTSSLALCPLSLRHPPSCWGDTPAAQTTGTGGPLACTGRLVPQGLTTALHFGGRLKGERSVMPAGVGPTSRPPAGAHPARVRGGRPQDPLTGQVKEPVVVRHVWLGFRHRVPLCQQGGWSSGLCQLEDPRAGDGHLGCLGHLGHLDEREKS